MDLQKEIEKLESFLYSTIGTVKAFEKLIKSFSQIQGENLSKKKVLEYLRQLQTQNIAQKIKTEGALEFARGLNEKKSTKGAENLDLEIQENFEESEDFEEEPLDPNLRKMYGLDEEDEEDEEDF